MAKLDRRTRRQILASLCEGVSIRSCERIFDVEQNSVAKLLADAGDMAITLMKRTKGLMVETIQADELYSFVGAKQVNVDRMTVPVEGAGTVWGYLAVCAKSKLIFNYHLGDRSYPHPTALTNNCPFAKSPPGGRAAWRCRGGISGVAVLDSRHRAENDD